MRRQGRQSDEGETVEGKRSHEGCKGGESGRREEGKEVEGPGQDADSAADHLGQSTVGRLTGACCPLPCTAGISSRQAATLLPFR